MFTAPAWGGLLSASATPHQPCREPPGRTADMKVAPRRMAQCQRLGAPAGGEGTTGHLGAPDRVRESVATRPERRLRGWSSCLVPVSHAQPFSGAARWRGKAGQRSKVR